MPKEEQISQSIFGRGNMDIWKAYSVIAGGCPGGVHNANRAAKSLQLRNLRSRTHARTREGGAFLHARAHANAPVAPEETVQIAIAFCKTQRFRPRHDARYAHGAKPSRGLARLLQQWEAEP